MTRFKLFSFVLFVSFVVNSVFVAHAQIPARGFSILGGPVAHDGAAGGFFPLLIGCYASAAAPSDVSADADATRAWCLRNGALAVQPAFAGVLWSTGNGTAGTGTPRVTIASDNSAFGVNATLSAETTKVIGTVNIASGQGPNVAQDIKLAYAASANQTVTALDGLASSATWVAGWESGAIDNTTNLYDDYRVTAKLTVASSGLSAGEIRLYLVGMLDDSTWPDVFDGTQSAETITDTEIRDGIALRCAVTATDTTASRVYYLDCPSVARVFGGNLPAKFVIFIAQSTASALQSSGNQVTIKGRYRRAA